jgi:hypothetical protein
MCRPAPFLVQSGPNLRVLACAWLGRAARAALALSLLLVLIDARPARAAGPEVAELEYDRPAELSGCPDEETFRRAVTDRLGRDPFVRGASRKIRVLLTQTGATLTALVRVEEAGRARGERRIETRSGCGELASGAALAVSIAIDPLVALGLPAQPEPAHPEPAPKPAPKPASKPASERSKPPAEGAERPPQPAPSSGAEGTISRAFMRGGVRAWAGVVPEISAGPSVGVGYQHGLGSLALDGIAVLPRTESVADTRRAVAVALLAAQLSPCAHLADLRACALFTSGAMFARGEGVDDPRTGTSYFASVGLGLGYSFFTGRFALTPIIEASARLTTTQLTLDNDLVWSTPRVFGSLGLEMSYDVSR